jgi:hypothetical protein
VTIRLAAPNDVMTTATPSDLLTFGDVGVGRAANAALLAVEDARVGRDRFSDGRLRRGRVIVGGIFLPRHYAASPHVLNAVLTACPLQNLLIRQVRPLLQDKDDVGEKLRRIRPTPFARVDALSAD